MAEQDGDTTPLLDGGHHEQDQEQGQDQESQPTLLQRIENLVHEPLTPLSQALLVVLLVLLLISSIFVGLFAGVSHKLELERRKHNEEARKTVTVTTTVATSHAETSTATTTWITTATATTTDRFPIPVPTKLPEKVCMTPRCVLLSASILSSLNISQDPCENFYHFANGGWLGTHLLPPDRGSYDQFDVVSERNTRFIREILQSDHPHPPSLPGTPHTLAINGIDGELDYDTLILGKLRSLFRSCLDEKLLSYLGQDPLMHVLRVVKKLFRENITHVPIPDVGELDVNKERDVNIHDLRGVGLTNALAYMHSKGIGALFTYRIDGDIGVNSNVYTLWLSQPSLGLPAKELYKDQETVDLYEKTVERLLLTFFENDDDSDSYDGDEKSSATHLPPLQISDEENTQTWPPWPWPPWDGGKDKEPANKTKRAHDLAREVIKFETRIAEASLDSETLRDDPAATYNPVSLSNLTELLPQVDFQTYLPVFTPPSFPSKIVLTHPSFFANLSSILTHADNDTVEAYLVSRAALQLAPLLSAETEAWKAVHVLHEKLDGIKKEGVVHDRADFCVKSVESAFGFALGRYFVQEKFSDRTGEKSAKIFVDIINAIKSSFAHSEWMDEKSSAAAAKKADAMEVKLGYPTSSPDTRDPRQIFSYYQLVDIHDDAFFWNMLNAATVDVHRQWLQLGRKRDPESWKLPPTTVDAVFNPSTNQIEVPAALLQPPFFSHEWPAYLAYGSLGMVAAHELTHAFDSSGRFYDQHGKLKDWWTELSAERYNLRRECIVKQYSEYTVDDGKGGKVYVNGNLTSRENIADLGLVQSYRAWQGQLKSSFEAGNEHLLPGLNYTRDQLFFISFAQVWANKMTPAAAMRHVLADPHSPNQIRVDGTVYNIPEFAEAFKCSKDARLNPPPDKRCLFW